MADLDRDLANRLTRLASAVPVAPSQLDPVHRTAVAARQRVRLAWITPLIALVVIVGLSALVGPRPSPGATPSLVSAPPSASSAIPTPFLPTEPVVSTSRDGDFDLVLRAGKHVYAPNEPIDITAALTYRGAAETVDISTDSGGPIVFGIFEKVYGEIQIGGLSDLMCKHSTLTRDQPLVSTFKKMGGFDGDHPQASQFQAFFADPQLRLPTGTWHIYAASGSPCLGSEIAYSLRAEIEIVVADDPMSTPGIPVATDWQDKPVYGGDDVGSVVLQLKSGHSRYEEGAPIDVVVSYWFADGPTLVASHFGPEAELSIDQLDATQPKQLLRVYDSACVDLGRVDGMQRDVAIGPGLMTFFRADVVPDGLDALFVDGSLRLPAGRWRITAVVAGTFGPCSAPGDQYQLRASIEIEVVKPAT